MDTYCSGQEKETSFPSSSSSSSSSTLLDSIYRSIDKCDEKIILHNQTMKKKKNFTSFERVFKVDKWMEKQVIIEKEFLQLDFVRRKGLRNDIKSSSSTSSSSSSGGGFSSSDEKSSGHGVCSNRFNNYAEEINFFINERERRDRHAKEGSIMRTKSKALKIYRDLKKLKQPISPGGRVTSFLNSIFIAGNTKKTKISSNYNETGSERAPKSGNGSTSSSASSYSRSCLSKKPSSRVKSSNDDKRSVRFCPSSVIVDDDNNNKELKTHSMDRNRQANESARELLINTQRKVDFKIGSQEFRQMDNSYEDDEENDSSCASSDLFELNNLSDIGNGIGKYLQELPVYETTSLGSLVASMLD